MARNRKRKALYEVIGSRRSNTSYSKELEHLHPEGPGKEPTDQDSIIQSSSSVMQWPKRSRLVQFNADRLEISMPYQLVIVLFLALILLGLVLFWLGRNFARQKTDSVAETSKTVQRAVMQLPAGTAQTPAEAGKAPQSAAESGLAGSKATNRIVIQTWSSVTQLEPVEKYFAENGVQTEIRKIGDMYYLVTVEKYENPQKPGTDGYVAREKIVELGAKYKAPPGYGSFGLRPFYDAYGMRFDD